MSWERSQSLDRDLRRQHKLDMPGSRCMPDIAPCIQNQQRCQSLDLHRQRKLYLPEVSCYVPDRSTFMSPPTVRDSPRYVHTTPRRIRYHDGGMSPTNTLEEYNMSSQFDKSLTIPCDIDVNEPTAQGYQHQNNGGSTQYLPEDVSMDLLDNFVEPSFYEPNDTYDELMCAFAKQSPPTQQLSTHGHDIDMGGARIADNHEQTNIPLCPYVIEPLPEDPYDIPPHPKDPDDVVGFIRRSRAIQRLRDLKEAEAAAGIKKGPVNQLKRREAKKSKVTQRQPQSLAKQTSKSASASKKRINVYPAKEQPPDYVSPEYAAAILQARTLAGLKTTNPQLLQTTKPPSVPTTASHVIPPAPTYENILERAAAIRAKSSREFPKRLSISPKGKYQTTSEGLQKELDEFEALERLLDPQSQQYSTPMMRELNILERVHHLERELFESPPVSAPKSPAFELPPVIRYYDLIRRQEDMLTNAKSGTSAECQLPEYDVNLQNIQDLADWNLAELSAICPSPQAAASTLNNAHFQNIEIPEFGILDMPEYAYSVGTLDEATPRDDVLGDISMPADLLNEDISQQEWDLEDVSCPALDDLSVSIMESVVPDYDMGSADKEKTNEGLSAEKDQEKSSGFLTTVVGSMIDKVKNIFVGPSKEYAEEEEGQHDILDSSLPNIFEASISSETQTPNEVAIQATASKTLSPMTITSHSQEKNEYTGIGKGTHRTLHQVIKPTDSKGKMIKDTKSTISKRTQLAGKSSVPPRVYPPGEYSPSYVAAVAKARLLAGYKNKSAILNPERAAKIAALKAAEEALTPAERIRKKMARTIQKRGHLPQCTPSIEMLGAIEAIRENLPKPDRSFTPKLKWKPAIRQRADRRHKTGDSSFTKEFSRTFGGLKPMTPIEEADSSFIDTDLIHFSPLRPHEARLRLRHLKEHGQHISPTVKMSTHADCKSPMTQEIDAVQYHPIRLESPKSAITEEMRKETITTRLGENGAEESIRKEIIQTSMIENGQINTTTQTIITKTDEHGNVTRHILEDKDVADEDSNTEYIDEVDAPEFLDISDILQPKDSSIPTPSEIIDIIRNKVQRKLNLSLPQVKSASESPLHTKQITVLPKDLPEEQIFEVDEPQLWMTPPQVTLQEPKPSPNVSLPYYWDEVPASAHQSSTHPPGKSKIIHPMPICETNISRQKSPHKDYDAMKNRDKVTQKQQDKIVANTNVGKVKTFKDQIKYPKKYIPKKKSGGKQRECPAQSPSISAAYAAQVGKARQLAGYKNTTIALNPKLAAKIESEKAAQEEKAEAVKALSDYEQIMKRMEQLRGVSKRQQIVPSVDVHGSMPPQLPQSTTVYPKEASLEVYETGIATGGPRDKSLGEFEALERQIETEDFTEQQLPITHRPTPKDISLDEFEALEMQIETEKYKRLPVPDTAASHASKDISLDKLEALKRQRDNQIVASTETPKAVIRARRGRNIIQELTYSPSARIQELYNELLSDQQIYDKLVADFASKENEKIDGLEDLMPSTPVCLNERLRIVKAAQQRPVISRETDIFDKEYTTPAIHYSPLTILTPNGLQGDILTMGAMTHDSPPVRLIEDNILLHLKTPIRQFVPPKHFNDLEDMPFDELEFELEPKFPNISLELAMTPPPKPSELINRIRKQVQSRLRKETLDKSQTTTLPNIPFPIEFPEEELFEISVPHYEQTITIETPPIRTSPNISLPYAWGEVAPPTSKTFESPKLMSTDKSTPLPSPSKDPKKIGEIMEKPQTIHKPKSQREFLETVDVPVLPKKKLGIPVQSKLGRQRVMKGGLPFIKASAQQHLTAEGQEVICPLEPPPLPAGYAEAVAQARLLAGYKNKTAALNPVVAAKLAKKKADAAAFEALPQHEKLKVKLNRLRSMPRSRLVKPTMEQIAFLQHLKESNSNKSPETQHFVQQSSITPRSLERKLHSSKHAQDMVDDSLLEFEALEALEAPLGQYTAPPPGAVLEIKRKIAELQNQLGTPPQVDLGERYRQLLTQMHSTPKTPMACSPLKTPDIRYSPINLDSSPVLREKSKFDTSQNVDDLEGVVEPSFFETTPITPTEAPRPRDIIARIQRDVQAKAQHVVPTAQLIDLRTPPRTLPLPEGVPEEELLQITCPMLRTPTQSPESLRHMSPDISLPNLFTPVQSTAQRSSLETPIQPHPLPAGYAEQVDEARRKAGLKNRSAALNTNVAEEAKAKSIPTGYDTLISKIAAMRKRGPQIQPSIDACLDKKALKIPPDMITPPESPKARLDTSSCPADIAYSPLRLMSPHIHERANLQLDNFGCLQNIENLEDFEQPSQMELSASPMDVEQYTPPPSPRTPQPTPSQLISRIREKVKQQLAAENAKVCEKSLQSSPMELAFPKNFPEEDILDISDPSFETTPQRPETPMKTPDISLPRYFDLTPHRSISPLRPTSTLETAESNATPSPKKLEHAESPIQAPELPLDYRLAVAQARSQACLKNTSALLNPQRLAQNYDTIKQRAAAWKAQIEQINPTAQKISAAKQIINYRQRQERKRQLRDLQRRRNEDNLVFEGITTPRTVTERYQAFKSKIPLETPIASHMPYSPIKSPDFSDIPTYEPIPFPTSPMCPLLQNISESNIAETSMPFENQSLQSISPRQLLPDSSPGLLEFEALEQIVGEIENRQRKIARTPKETQNVMVETLHKLERIVEAQKRLLNESEKIQETQSSPRIPPAIEELNELDSFEEMERLCRSSNQYSEGKENQVDDQYFNLSRRIEMLKNQLLQTPTQCVNQDENSLLETHPLQQRKISQRVRSPTEDLKELDSFEEMERLCRTPSDQNKERLQKMYTVPPENGARHQHFNLNRRIEMLKNQLLQSPKCILPDSYASPGLSEFEALEQLVYEENIQPTVNLPIQKEDHCQMVENFNRLEQIATEQERLLNDNESLMERHKTPQNKRSTKTTSTVESFNDLDSFEEMERLCKTPTNQ